MKPFFRGIAIAAICVATMFAAGSFAVQIPAGDLLKQIDSDLHDIEMRWRKNDAIDAYFRQFA